MSRLAACLLLIIKTSLSKVKLILAADYGSLFYGLIVDFLRLMTSMHWSELLFLVDTAKETWKCHKNFALFRTFSRNRKSVNIIFYNFSHSKTIILENCKKISFPLPEPHAGVKPHKYLTVYSTTIHIIRCPQLWSSKLSKKSSKNFLVLTFWLNRYKVTKYIT